MYTTKKFQLFTIKRSWFIFILSSEERTSCQLFYVCEWIVWHSSRDDLIHHNNCIQYDIHFRSSFSTIFPYYSHDHFSDIIYILIFFLDVSREQRWIAGSIALRISSISWLTLYSPAIGIGSQIYDLLRIQSRYFGDKISKYQEQLFEI